MYACMLSCFSHVPLCATVQIHGVQPTRLLIHRILQSRILSGLPFPSPGDLPIPGMESASHVSCIGRRFFITSSSWEAQTHSIHIQISDLILRCLSIQINSFNFNINPLSHFYYFHIRYGKLGRGRLTCSVPQSSKVVELRFKLRQSSSVHD